MLLVGVAIGGCGGSGHKQQTTTGGAGTSASGGTSTGSRASTSSTTPSANLRISYRAHRLSGSTQVWTLSCRPTGGDHPHPATACAELASHAQILIGGGVRGRVTCGIVLANGPTVVVTGTIDGHAVHFSPVSICDLGWSELPVLLTGGSSASTSGTATHLGGG